MDTVLEAVSKGYGDKLVLHDFSLRLRAGERLCVQGPSGCGKTTLLRLIAGLEAPERGRITGRPERIAVQFQENRLLPWRSVRENLGLVTDKPDTWLGRVLLTGEGNRYPGELSGGMQRRVALARALAFPSDALLLDEPLKELDEATREKMMELILAHVGSRTLLLITHDPREAEILCQRRLVLGSAGRDSEKHP